MRHRVEERMESYKKTFNVVICNDSDLSFVVELVKYIVEEDDYSALKEEEGEGNRRRLHSGSSEPRIVCLLRNRTRFIGT